MNDNDIYVSQSEFTRRWNEKHPEDKITKQYVSKLVIAGEFEKLNNKIPFVKCESVLIEKKKNPEREAQRIANKEKKLNPDNSLFNEKNKPETSITDLNEDELKVYNEKFSKDDEIQIKNDEENKDTNGDIKSLEDATFNDVKKFKEYYQGLQAKLNYEKESGEYIKKEDVEREAFEIARIVRNKLLSVPSRVSAVIASMNDKREVQGYIYDEIYNCLVGFENER